MGVEERYNLYFDLRPYQKKPNLGEIIEGAKRENRLARKTSSYTIEEVLQKFGSGFSGYGATMKYEKKGSEIIFHEAKLLMIDIDDDDEITNPEETMKETGANGLFYTFSHGIKGNRYRLVFVLSETIRDADFYKHVGASIGNKLISLGLPADLSPTQNITVPIRGGTNGYILNDEQKEIDVTKYEASYEAEKEKNERRTRFIQKEGKKGIRALAESVEYGSLTFDDLTEACEAIGYIPSGQNRYNEWARLMRSVGSYYQLGFLSLHEALELARIICGSEMNADKIQTNYFEKPIRNVSIGSLVHAATEKGWLRKRRYKAEPEPENFQRHALSSVEIDGKERLKVEDFERILDAPEARSLLVAATGSGKTYAALNAVKQRVAHYENLYYIFTAPTRSLAKQVQSTYGGFLFIGRNKGEDVENIHSVLKRGERLIVSTFDKAPQIVDLVEGRNGNVVLIVDEIHQLVTSFSYRSKALTSLLDTFQRPRVQKVVGITGTPFPLRLNDFQAVYTLEKKIASRVANKFFVYHYDFGKEFETLLLKLIEVRLKGNMKMLVFVNNIELAKRIRKELKKVLPDKQVHVISSNLKSELTREEADAEATKELKRITEKSNSVADCILTTSLLSDGISIEKNDSRFETLVIANAESNFFDVSQVVQTANRLREPYAHFSIMIQRPKDEKNRSKKNFLDLESGKAHKFHIANEIKRELEQTKGLFLVEELEERYGIRIDSSKNGKLGINHLKPLHLAHMEQASHYKKWRFSYVEKIGSILGIEPEYGDLKASLLEIGVEEEELNQSLELLDQLKENAKLENKEKAANVEMILTEEMHEAFKGGDRTLLQAAKKAMLSRHFNAAKSVASLPLSFDQWKTLIIRVTRDNESREFLSDLEAVVRNTSAIDELQRKKRLSKSLKTFQKFKDEQLGIERDNEDWKNVLNGYAKELKIESDDVKIIFEGRFVIQERSTSKVRYKKLIEAKNLTFICEKYGLNLDTAIQCFDHVSSLFLADEFRKNKKR